MDKQHRNGKAVAVDGDVDDQSSDASDADEPLELASFEEERNFIANLGKKKGRADEKRQEINLISKNDDRIGELIHKMKVAYEEDCQLNLEGKPATKKLTILKFVMSQLIKKDLQVIFLEHNILDVLTDWLSPLPNNTLPYWEIRSSILNLLTNFPAIDKSLLKESNIGKAVMYLYKHPLEVRSNRDLAEKLIADWSRIIFNLSSEFTAMSKEERQQHDKLTISSTKTDNDRHSALEREKDFLNEKDAEVMTPKGPRDPGWRRRASVPQQSKKTYVVRPTSTVDHVDASNANKRKPNRYDTMAMKFVKTMKENFK